MPKTKGTLALENSSKRRRVYGRSRRQAQGSFVLPVYTSPAARKSSSDYPSPPLSSPNRKREKDIGEEVENIIISMPRSAKQREKLKAHRIRSLDSNGSQTSNHDAMQAEIPQITPSKIKPDLSQDSIIKQSHETITVKASKNRIDSPTVTPIAFDDSFSSNEDQGSRFFTPLEFQESEKINIPETPQHQKNLAMEIPSSSPQYTPLTLHIISRPDSPSPFRDQVIPNTQWWEEPEDETIDQEIVDSLENYEVHSHNLKNPQTHSLNPQNNEVSLSSGSYNKQNGKKSLKIRYQSPSNSSSSSRHHPSDPLTSDLSDLNPASSNPSVIIIKDSDSEELEDIDIVSDSLPSTAGNSTQWHLKNILSDSLMQSLPVPPEISSHGTSILHHMNDHWAESEEEL